MFRTVNTLFIFLMVLGAAAVYDMKYEAETAAEAAVDLERRIEREQAEISLLKAEWSVLTGPARLQNLVERHAEILQLTPLKAEQIGTLADIPERPSLLPQDLTPSLRPAQQSANAALESEDMGNPSVPR